LEDPRTHNGAGSSWEEEIMSKKRGVCSRTWPYAEECYLITTKGRKKQKGRRGRQRTAKGACGEERRGRRSGELTGVPTERASS